MQRLPNFTLTSDNTLEGNVYIKRFKDKQYLVVSDLTFELYDVMKDTYNYWNGLAKKYYVQPETLEVGVVTRTYNPTLMCYVFRFVASAYDYTYDTKDHERTKVFEKIEKRGFLEIGRVMVNDQPFTGMLTFSETMIVQKALNWLSDEFEDELDVKDQSPMKFEFKCPLKTKHDKEVFMDAIEQFQTTLDKKRKVDALEHDDSVSKKPRMVYCPKPISSSDASEESSEESSEEVVKAETTVKNLLKPFTLTPYSSLRDNVKIVNENNQKYLLFGDAKFSLRSDMVYGAWDGNYYIHPLTLRCGRIQSDSSEYWFTTKNFQVDNFKNQYDIHNELVRCGYLRLCSLMIDNQFVQKYNLSEEDKSTIQKALDWLETQSNK